MLTFCKKHMHRKSAVSQDRSARWTVTSSGHLEELQWLMLTAYIFNVPIYLLKQIKTKLDCGWVNIAVLFYNIFHWKHNNQLSISLTGTSWWGSSWYREKPGRGESGKRSSYKWLRPPRCRRLSAGRPPRPHPLPLSLPPPSASACSPGRCWMNGY